jgi:hypothetical protein
MKLLEKLYKDVFLDNEGNFDKKFTFFFISIIILDIILFEFFV